MRALRTWLLATESLIASDASTFFIALSRSPARKAWRPISHSVADFITDIFFSARLTCCRVYLPCDPQPVAATARASPAASPAARRSRAGVRMGRRACIAADLRLGGARPSGLGKARRRL